MIKGILDFPRPQFSCPQICYSPTINIDHLLTKQFSYWDKNCTKVILSTNPNTSKMTHCDEEIINHMLLVDTLFITEVKVMQIAHSLSKFK